MGCCDPVTSTFLCVSQLDSLSQCTAFRFLLLLLPIFSRLVLKLLGRHFLQSSLLLTSDIMFKFRWKYAVKLNSDHLTPGDSNLPDNGLQRYTVPHLKMHRLILMTHNLCNITHWNSPCLVIYTLHFTSSPQRSILIVSHVNACTTNSLPVWWRWWWWC